MVELNLLITVFWNDRSVYTLLPLCIPEWMVARYLASGPQEHKKKRQVPVSCKWQTEGQRLYFPNLEEQQQHQQHKASSQEKMQIWSGNTNRRTVEKQKKRGSRPFICHIRRIALSGLTFSDGNNQKRAQDKSSVCCRHWGSLLQSESNAGCNKWLELDPSNIPFHIDGKSSSDFFSTCSFTDIDKNAFAASPTKATCLKPLTAFPLALE